MPGGRGGLGRLDFALAPEAPDMKKSDSWILTRSLLDTFWTPSGHLLDTFWTSSGQLLDILDILYTSPSVVMPIRLLLNMWFLHLKAVYNNKQEKNYPLRARLLPDARSASPLVSATVLLRAASIASR